MSAGTLAHAYRPRTFGDLVGQRPVQVVLQQMVLKSAVPPALLFDGASGRGKTAAARVLAAALSCDTNPGPCAACPSCSAVHDWSSPALVELDAAAQTDIEQLQRVVAPPPVPARVVLLDGAHSLSQPFAAGLLRMLEEPPEQTFFVLLTAQPSLLPPAVRGRCMRFTFRRVPQADLVARLGYICEREGMTVEPTLLVEVAARADGSPRAAVMLLDKVTRVGVSTREQLLEVEGQTDVAPRLVEAMLDGDLSAVFALTEEQLACCGDAAAVTTELVRVLRDVLVLRAGGQLPLDGARLAARRRLADRLSNEQAFRALSVLWDLRAKVRLDGDAAALLDLAAATIVRTLGGATTDRGPAERPMSLQEMQALSRR